MKIKSILGILSLLAVVGCTKGPSDDLIKEHIMTTNSLSANGSLAGFYELGDYKIVKRTEFDQGQGYKIEVEQKAKLLKDCHNSFGQKIENLYACLPEKTKSTNIYAKPQEFTVFYELNLYKGKDKPWVKTGMYPSKIYDNMKK